MGTYYFSILEYCKGNIEDFDEKLSRAFIKHIERGIPLYLANDSFTLSVQDCIDEWGEFEEIDTDEIDVEDFLIWALDE